MKRKIRRKIVRTRRLTDLEAAQLRVELAVLRLGYSYCLCGYTKEQAQQEYRRDFIRDL